MEIKCGLPWECEHPGAAEVWRVISSCRIFFHKFHPVLTGKIWDLAENLLGPIQLPPLQEKVQNLWEGEQKQIVIKGTDENPWKLREEKRKN